MMALEEKRFYVTMGSFRERGNERIYFHSPIDATDLVILIGHKELMNPANMETAGLHMPGYWGMSIGTYRIYKSLVEKLSSYNKKNSFNRLKELRDKKEISREGYEKYMRYVDGKFAKWGHFMEYVHSQDQKDLIFFTEMDLSEALPSMLTEYDKDFENLERISIQFFKGMLNYDYGSGRRTKP